MRRPQKVHFLPGVAAPQARTPQQGVIEVLEAALAGARSGEVQAVALCTVTFRNAVETDWSADNAPENLMVAAVSRLQHRILTAATTS